jgi:NAD(P)-dependent dehydrogenase (short-subunit alcohol dehydrogenase family)
MTRTALVTGGNRGIGLEVCAELARRGWKVLLGARDADAGHRAAGDLATAGLEVEPVRLDVADAGQVEGLAGHLSRIDALVNNAAIYPGGHAIEVDLDVAEQAWQTNALGAWRLCIAVIPGMRERRWGRIVNVSSQGGSLATMGAEHAAYRVSKAALNAITRTLAADLRGTGVLVNSVCPGWVRSDMGGPSAPRSIEQGAASVTWGVTIPDDGPTGGFFRDGEPLPW